MPTDLSSQSKITNMNENGVDGWLVAANGVVAPELGINNKLLKLDDDEGIGLVVVSLVDFEHAFTRKDYNYFLA